MKRSIVRTEKAPEPAGPYSQAVCVGDLVFTAGQMPFVPGTKEMAGSDIETQTRQVLKSIQAILEEAGSCIDHVLRCTVFLTDLSLYPQMNEVYAEFFANSGPARSTVPITPLPGGALIEIDAIAVRCDCGSDC